MWIQNIFVYGKYCYLGYNLYWKVILLEAHVLLVQFFKIKLVINIQLFTEQP